VAGRGETAGVKARRSAGRATDREVVVVAAVLSAGSEKAAAHRLGLSPSTVKHHLANARSKVGAETTAQLVWILAPRLPEPEDVPDGPRSPTSRPGIRGVVRTTSRQSTAQEPGWGVVGCPPSTRGTRGGDAARALRDRRGRRVVGPPTS